MRGNHKLEMFTIATSREGEDEVFVHFFIVKQAVDERNARLKFTRVEVGQAKNPRAIPGRGFFVFSALGLELFLVHAYDYNTLLSKREVCYNIDHA